MHVYKIQMLPLPSQAPKELCKHLALDAYKYADKYHDYNFRVSYTEKPAESVTHLKKDRVRGTSSHVPGAVSLFIPYHEYKQLGHLRQQKSQTAAC